MDLPGSPTDYGGAWVKLDMQDSKHWDINIITDFKPDIEVVKQFILGKTIDVDISEKDLNQIYYAVSEMYPAIQEKELSRNPETLEDLLDILYLKNEERQKEDRLFYKKESIAADRTKEMSKDSFGENESQNIMIIMMRNRLGVLQILWLSFWIRKVLLNLLILLMLESQKFIAAKNKI